MNTNAVRYVVVLSIGFMVGLGVAGLYRSGNQKSGGYQISTTPSSSAQSAASQPAARKIPPAAQSQAPELPILTLDDPRFVKRLEARDKKMIAAFREKHAASYDRLFSEYGLPPDIREAAFDHVLKIYEAKIQSRKYTTQLMEAQAAYQDKMKALLGEQYGTYAARERSWPVREEVEFISETGRELGVSLTAEKAAALAQFIESAGAFSWKSLGSLGGPMGEVPKITYGAENTVPLWEKQQAELSLHSASVLEQAKNAGFSDDEMRLLMKYYDDNVKFYDRFIDGADLTSPEKFARIEARIAQLTSTPGSDERELSRMRTLLEVMRVEISKKVRSSPSSP